MTAVLYQRGQLNVKAILVKNIVIFILMKITVYCIGLVGGGGW